MSSSSGCGAIPRPDTVENEYKEEHYRRIAYANERFASGIPGWKTDRGRIYITFGPADEVDEHPSGGTYHVRRLRAAAKPRRFRLRTGGIAISKESATTS